MTLRTALSVRDLRLAEMSGVGRNASMLQPDASTDSEAEKSHGRGRQRWMNRGKPALNAFAMTFGDRLVTNNNS